MITRRSFLSALAVLPVIGKWMPQAKAIQFHPKAFALTMEPIHAATGSDIFERHLSQLIMNPPAHLIADTAPRTMANIVDEAALRAINEEFGLAVSPVTE